MSCINAALLRHIQPRPAILNPGKVRLADGENIRFDGTTRLTIQICRQTYQHIFHVITGLDTQVIIGVDLWVRLKMCLPPPPLADKAQSEPPALNQVTGLAHRTEQEDQEIQQFLQTELRKFDNVSGTTDRTEHRIHLTDQKPIKQRYAAHIHATRRCRPLLIGRSTKWKRLA